MSIIAHDLHKNYRTKIKEEGIRASLKALWQPEYKHVTAVEGVSFEVAAGEVVAFIGPNGAGKSTTIKMMTGILQPSAGSVNVLGFNPASERAKLAMQIGSVFGQRSQLWLHLPPLDSFALLARIYELEEEQYRRRLAELCELFELDEMLKTPVRKLSLGQRIRCEIAASLLHRPKVIFLDEPTIGLDVVVKQTIRKLIAELNREEGTTIFLTSHDAGDVEQLCKRALVIDRGKLIIDEEVDSLKRRYFGRKVIEITFFSETNLNLPPEVSFTRLDSNRIRLVVDTRQTAVGELLKGLVSEAVISDVTVLDPPMEEIIAAIYSRKEGEADESS